MINFPIDPEIGQNYTDPSTNITWIWTGETWDFECELPPSSSYIGVSPIDVTTFTDELGNKIITISHEESGVVSGTYNSFTVDEFGHIIDASTETVGHIIQNSGSDMPQRRYLDFRRMIVTDNQLFNQTVVTRPPSVSVGVDPPTEDLLEGDEWIDSLNWKKYIRYDDYWVETGKVEPSSSSGSFEELNDTFTFEGNAGKFAVVNDDETALIPVNLSDIIFDNYVEISYSDLKELVDNSQLSVGTWYKIIDYQTIHLIPNTVDINTGPLEPLYVNSIDVDKFASRVYSEDYPNDIIEYDFANILCEDGTTPRKGKIEFRHDIKSDTYCYYDWRNAKWRRWKILSKQEEVVTKLTDTTLDCLLTFSTGVNLAENFFTTNRRLHVQIGEITHDAGDLTITIRKGTGTSTKPLIKWNGLPWTANELSNTAGIISNCLVRDAFVYFNYRQFGKEILNTYSAKTGADVYSVGDGLRYDVDPLDFEDYLTFNGTHQNISVGKYNNPAIGNNIVFIGNVKDCSIDSQSFNNTIRGQIINARFGKETQNCMFSSDVVYSTLHTEPISCYFGRLSHFNSWDHMSASTVYAPPFHLTFDSTVSGCTVAVSGNMTIFNQFIENSGIFLSGASAGDGRSGGTFQSLMRSSLVGFFNSDDLVLNKRLINSSFYKIPDVRNYVKSLNIEQSPTPIGEVKILGRDEDGNVVDGSDLIKVSAIDGINNVGENELVLGGFVIEPTKTFEGFKDDLAIQSDLNSFFSYSYPALATTPNAVLYNMRPVLGDKILFVSDRVSIIFNIDGTIYKPNNKPWIYRGATRNYLLTDTHVFLVANFGQSFITYDENFNQLTVSGKTTIIKVELSSGEVDPIFNFRTTNNTFFQSQPGRMVRVHLVDNDDIFFHSNMLSYDGEEQGFYLHVISGLTGELTYSNKISNTAIGFCTDSSGCGTSAEAMATAVDSENRLYLSFPMLQYNPAPSVPSGEIRAIFRFNLNVADPPGNNISFQLDQNFGINFAYTGTGFIGYNIIFITSDDNVIIATTQSSVLTNVTIDGNPVRSIMKFDKNGNIDSNFGIGIDGRKGIYTSFPSTIVPRYIKEDRPGIYRLALSSALYNNDIVSKQIDFILFDENGLIIEELEGFTLSRSDISGKFVNSNDTIINTTNSELILHPTIDQAIIHTRDPNITNKFIISDNMGVTITSLNSFSYYELINKPYVNSPYAFNTIRTPTISQNISLGYSYNNSIKFNKNSFITQQFFEDTVNPEFEILNNLNIDDITNNGNITTNTISHADGIDPQDSATIGQVNLLLEGINTNLQSALNIRTFGIDIDGSGNPITSGLKGYSTIPYDCEILAWSIIGDTVGSIEIDIWKSNVIPTGTDSICAGNRPKLINQQFTDDDILTGWTLTIDEGDIIAFNVISSSLITKVNLVIKIKLI
jgi:hypothetical protein